MVQSKSDVFVEELKTQAAWFKVLAHPARLRILQYLSEANSCITGDLSEELPLGRTTVNQHIKELKEASLIQGHIEGVRTKYCLNPEKIAEVKAVIEEFLGALNVGNYECK
jgi:DNA-binding transcriptional ArsR family regulator